MPETSRECVVCLLDETSFTVPVLGNLMGNELLDMAASHVSIKEKEYFGLYTDGDGFKNWLELDKPVLDPSQDLPKGSGSVKIHFAFKYFVDDLRLLTDFMTVELLYLQCRHAVMKGEICSDDDTIFELAACAMQSQFGQIRSEPEAKQQLKSFPIIPSHVFKRVSVAQCEDFILEYYRMLRNLSRGEAIYKYLEIILSLPMYSMHFFEVKDKKDVALWLGVGPDGICQCPHSNRNDPDYRFQWLQLQNIYYRDRKFSMEVYQSNKPSKKGVGFGPVIVHAWHGANSKVVMAIWKMARDQHVFYRSKRTNRNPHIGMNQTEISRQLNKLHRANISPNSSQSSLSIESAKSNQTQASAEAVAAAKAAQSEMYSALLARRQILMSEFERKAARYKEILVKEMQITGIPPEGLTAEEIEKMRKKFGVSFKFSKFVLDDNLGSGDEVEQLEKQLEVQSSIIEASKTLLEQANNRKLKKDRKKEIKQMENRYQELEQRLCDLKRHNGGSTLSGGTRFYGESPGSVPVSRRRSGTPGGASIDDNFLASMIFDTPTKPKNSPGGLQKSPHHKSTSALSDVQMTSPTSAKLHPSPAPSKGKSYTLSVTESSSYLSSIGGYTDEYELSPSSSIASGSASFVSSSGAGGQQIRGTPGYNQVGVGGGDTSLGGHSMDLADEILQHFSGEDQRLHHSRSPTGSYNSAHKGGDHAPHHIDLPVSSSPISRYKRASSPTIGLPTETSRHQFAPSHDNQPHHHHSGSGHSSRGGPHVEARRSHSPDYPPGGSGGGNNNNPPYSHAAVASGYHQKSLIPQKVGAPPNQHSYQQQRSVGGVPPHNHFHQGGGSHEIDPREAQRRYLAQGSKTMPNPSRTNPLSPSGNSGSATSAVAVGAVPGTGPAGEGPGGQPPSQRGPRKASDQEMGLLEVLNMWDKSNKNPFGDGTLV